MNVCSNSIFCYVRVYWKHMNPGRVFKGREGMKMVSSNLGEHQDVLHRKTSPQTALYNKLFMQE